MPCGLILRMQVHIRNAHAWLIQNVYICCSAGIRYPARLLNEVVAILRTAQAMLKAPSSEVSNGEAPKMSNLAVPSKSQAAVQAAAMGASMRSWAEPFTPVHPPSLSKAFRCVCGRSSLHQERPACAELGYAARARCSNAASRLALFWLSALLSGLSNPYGHAAMLISAIAAS